MRWMGSRFNRCSRKFWVDGKVAQMIGNIQSISITLLEDASTSCVTIKTDAGKRISITSADGDATQAKTDAGNAQKHWRVGHALRLIHLKKTLYLLDTSCQRNSHLADALKQTADATEALNRLKTPQTLKSDSDMVAAFGAF